jgi:hypothetical protein
VAADSAIGVVLSMAHMLLVLYVQAVASRQREASGLVSCWTACCAAAMCLSAAVIAMTSSGQAVTVLISNYTSGHILRVASNIVILRAGPGSRVRISWPVQAELADQDACNCETCKVSPTHHGLLSCLLFAALFRHHSSDSNGASRVRVSGSTHTYLASYLFVLAIMHGLNSLNS